ncbi:MAG: hypothetical protein K2N34_06870 [Lachnospiraceae bacterium]|nr:hypothetical protein [Lachnospiraceae bacterium]
MKKFALPLLLAMTLFFMACGTSTEEQSSSTLTEQSVATEADASSAPTSKATITPKPTPAPTNTPSPTPEPTALPTIEPTALPTQAPSAEPTPIQPVEDITSKAIDETSTSPIEEPPVSDTSAEQVAVVAPLPVEASTSETNSTLESNSSNGDDSNFNTYDYPEQHSTEATYVLNTSTKKIHYPSCSSVKKIAPQNYSTSNSSIDELKGQGYTTCGNCFK